MQVFTAARRPIRRARRSGFTLTEIAIVLGIIGMIMGAIWTAAGSAHNSQKINDAVNELQTTSQNMIALYAGQPFTGSVPANITTNMITAQVIPANYVTSSSTATSPFNGPFSIYFYSARTYLISFVNVPMSACIAMLTQATSCQAGQLGCPVSVDTAWGAAPLPATGYATSWLGIATVSNFESLCSSNTPSKNSVDFQYSI